MNDIQGVLKEMDLFLEDSTYIPDVDEWKAVIEAAMREPVAEVFSVDIVYDTFVTTTSTRSRQYSYPELRLVPGSEMPPIGTKLYAFPLHSAMEIRRLHERVASAGDGLLERDDEIEQLKEALNQEHACLAMELTMIRDYADSMHIKDLEWRREFIRAALNKEDKT